MVKICTKETGNDNCIVTYGDGILLLAIKGINDGWYDHKLLMMLLLKEWIGMTVKYIATSLPKNIITKLPDLPQQEAIVK